MSETSALAEASVSTAQLAHSIAQINARLDRLPASRSLWALVLLVAIGGWFEFYDLFMTAYIGPGLVRSGLYSVTTASFFGVSGLAAFVGASFAGLFVGTLLLTGLADRFGRKTIFTGSLLWYSLATLVMAFQNSAPAINAWRFIAGIGIGVELVVIDTYIGELVPAHIRGRTFALVHGAQYTAVPFVALVAWLFERHPLAVLDGWRLTAIVGALGAIAAWFIRRGIPESPRWLAQQGRLAQAAQVLDALELRIRRDGKSLRACDSIPLEPAPRSVRRARFSEIRHPPYRRRTVVLLVFHLVQSIGFYGFASWVPTLLIAKGIKVTDSLQYSFIIAAAYPIGPLIGFAIADKIERKTIIVVAAFAVALFGGLCAVAQSPALLIVLGVLVTFGNTLMSTAYHAYQAELYPTRIRARAVGFVYSLSRLSAMFSGFMIASTLRNFGTAGVFTLITAVMILVMADIGIFGPKTNQKTLDEVSS